MKFLFLLIKCVCLLLLLQAQLLIGAEDTPLTRSNDLLQELNRYRSQIEELESQFGPYHRRLLEPLESLVSLLAADGEYQQVASLQNRQLQVMRTVLGFEHPDLVPLLQAIIATQIRLGNWQQVADQLGHIRYVTSIAAGKESVELLLAIENQAFWFLNMVQLDERKDRAKNFMAARQMYEEMERLAEDIFAEDSPKLIPWYYKRAVNEYRLVEFLNVSNGISSDVMEQLIREEGMFKLENARGRARTNSDLRFGLGRQIPVIDGDLPVGEAYLGDSFNLLRHIKEIAATQGDLEAQAMAEIYQGDFMILRDRRGRSLQYFRRARTMLLEAGLAKETIDQYFSRPAVIPYDKFYTRLGDVIAYQQDSLDQIEELDSNVIHLGVFTAWNESLPSTPKPIADNPALELELNYNQVDLSFEVNSSGRTASREVLKATPPERSVERKASRALREIHFRPAIIDDKATGVRDLQIRYRYVED